MPTGKDITLSLSEDTDKLCILNSCSVKENNNYLSRKCVVGAVRHNYVVGVAPRLKQ